MYGSVIGTFPLVYYTMVVTIFLWIGDPDPDHLFIRLYDSFPDPDPPLITRSFDDPDPDPLFLTRSRIANQ